MGAMNVQVLKSTSNSVIVEVIASATDQATTAITWTHLAELFNHPDGASYAPALPQQASVTGERQKAKTDLVCKSISWSNNDNVSNGPEMAITWEGGTAMLLYAVPDDAGSHVFSDAGLRYNGGTLDATDAVTIGVPSNTLTGTEYMRVEFEFSSNLLTV